MINSRSAAGKLLSGSTLLAVIILQCVSQQQITAIETAPRITHSTTGHSTTGSSSDDLFSIEKGSVTTIVEAVSTLTMGSNVDYLHCGPKFHHTASPDPSKREIILLHSSFTTKEDWETSTIMQQLCEKGGNKISVTAIDIKTKKNGLSLFQTFWGLRSQGVISGEPAIIVTPAASGKTIVSAAETDLAQDHSSFHSTLLGRMCRGWVSISVGAVMVAHNDAMRMFTLEKVPVLAVHGKDDEFAAEASETLEKFAGANILEMEGGSDPQFNDPDVFVAALLQFAEDSVALGRSDYPKASEVVGPTLTGGPVTLRSSPTIYDFEVTSGEIKTVDIDVHYLHCGPSYGRMPKGIGYHSKRQEVLLLHGSKFSKNDWRDSGIMERLCKHGGDHLSVTAVDMKKRSMNANKLQDTFRTLHHEGVISGNPLIVVTPSISGKTIVHTAMLDLENENEDILGKMVQGWLCLACSGVTSKNDDALALFKQKGIPVLAMHGIDDDRKGVSVHLQKVSGADVVEVPGPHAWYLDSPDLFVNKFVQFLGHASFLKPTGG